MEEGKSSGFVREHEKSKGKGVSCVSQRDVSIEHILDTLAPESVAATR